MFDPIAYNREYHRRPDIKERMKQYNQRPEVKERIRQYNQRPEVKARNRAYMKVYNRRPEIKVRHRAYSQRPEVKARMLAYHRDKKHLKYVCAKRAIKMMEGLGYSNNVTKALIMDGKTLDYQLRKRGIKFKRGRRMQK